MSARFNLSGHELFARVRAQWPLAVGIPLVACALAVAVAQAGPRQYVAQASFTHAPVGTPGAGDLGWAMDAGYVPDLRESLLTIRFYAGLVHNRGFLRDLAAHELAVPLPDGTVLRGPLGTLVAVDQRANPASEATLFRVLRRAIVAVPDREALLLYVRVKATHAELAESVAAAVVDEVQRFDVERRTGGARHERRFVEERLRDAEYDLVEAEAALAAFDSRNRLENVSAAVALERQRRERAVAEKDVVYRALVRAGEEARTAEALDFPSLRIIHDPSASATPDRSRFWVKGLTALLLGGSLSILIIVMREFDLRVRNARPARYREICRIRAAISRGQRATHR
jgi:uncharacterized protein involved in exopolysaccharide biosynthesis